MSQEKAVVDYWLDELYIDKFRHLSDITLSFDKTTNVIGISGENGTGKSTILALIACKHSRKENTDNWTNNAYYLFKDGEYFTMGNFMKNTTHDSFGNDWKVKYKVSTHSKDGRLDEESNLYYFERHSSYTGNNWIGFKNEDRFNRPLYYWRWKDNIPAIENAAIAKNLKDYSLSGANYEMNALILSLKHVFGDRTISVESLKKTADNPYTSVFKMIDHSTYNAAAGKDKAMRMLALLHKLKKGSLFLIDEFEVGLHPKIQVSLLKEIRRIAQQKELQVILTTHSRDVIKELSLEERVHLKRSLGKVFVHEGASERFIFSDISDERQAIYCEDEVAAVWIEEIARINGKRETLDLMVPLPIGACSAVLQHSKAAYIEFDKFITVLDGDKLAEKEVEKTIKSDKFFQKIPNDKIELVREMYATNLSYLPSDKAPEKLFHAYLLENEDLKNVFIDRYNLTEDEYDDLVKDLKNVKNHHDYFGHIASYLREDEERFIRESLRLLVSVDDDIKEQCRKLADWLEVVVRS